MPHPLLLAAALLASSPAGTGGASGAQGYAPAAPGDTVRTDSTTVPGEVAVRTGAAADGFLSDRGLPPRPGRLTVTDSGLVFRSTDGLLVRIYRRAGTVPVHLAYVEAEQTLPVFLFRVDAGVFGTESPGPLLAAEHSSLPGSPGRWLRGPERALAATDDSAGILRVLHRIESGGYADTLYSLFGRPHRPVGLVGRRGRKAGRLGEYIGTRDSLALDPARITSEDQLRHAMAHELGHRWQNRAPGQLRVLWRDIAPIRDRGRYGYGSRPEQQAEAIAFAVHYLQTTASMPADAAALDLLERYELLVPGTRLMTRYLSLQPIYAHHPLRRLLLGGPSS